MPGGICVRDRAWPICPSLIIFSTTFPLPSLPHPRSFSSCFSYTPSPLCILHISVLLSPLHLGPFFSPSILYAFLLTIHFLTMLHSSSTFVLTTQIINTVCIRPSCNGTPMHEPAPKPPCLPATPPVNPGKFPLSSSTYSPHAVSLSLSLETNTQHHQKPPHRTSDTITVSFPSRNAD